MSAQPPPNPKHDEESLFARALELPASGRAAFLAEASGGDVALRRRVEALLAAHEGAGGFLDKPDGNDRPTVKLTLPVDEGPGTLIGRYKLLEKLGEGGFGVVYVAEQREPVRRRVALKIIKLGMDTRQVVGRFEAERQALALMDHPNIAKVLDAGSTETGRPYFVMELVRGIRLTDYCDQNNLSTRARLDLVIKVCQAIQHAHQKGIIHRDIKPSNLLVTLHDGVPVPKVIDFGIAKATQGELTDKTVYTQFQQFIGTPAYMSPEQAEMSGLDIDTRSDIYALGVLLYELFTGRTPFDQKELLAAGLDEMRRIIREQEPVRPSTRVSSLQGEDLTTTAKHRGSDAPKLIHLLRGDLDWIVMKALEKDRTRRYDTASSLAQDIERYLKDEPVTAVAPSVAYQATKFVRRHRAAVSFVTALAVTIIAGAGVSLWQSVRAAQQAALAEARRREADSSREQAADAQKRAEHFAKEVAHQLARQYVDNGNLRLAQDDYFGSLLWFAEALRLDEGDPKLEATHRLRIGTLLRQCPKLLQFFSQKGSAVSAEFSLDGQRLVTAGGVWNVNTGELLVAIPAPGGDVIWTAFSPEGQRIVTAGEDKTARIWNASTGAPLTPPMQHASNVWSAPFSPDGRRIVTASEDKTARVWDAITGQPLTPPLRHEDAVWPAAFSPDGHLVVTASQDKTARIWDADTGQPIAPPLQHTGKVWWATFSPDGELVATASEDHTARIWNAHTGAPVAPALQHSEEVTCAAFSPDGQRLVTASGESIFRLFHFNDRPGEARVWDVVTGKPLTPPMPHKLSVFYAAFSPDGRRVVTASEDKTARVWDAWTAQPVTPPLLHDDIVFRVSFSPDGRCLATAGLDHAAKIWDMTRVQQDPVALKESWLASACSVSFDCQFVAGKYFNGPARVWNAVTGTPITPLLQHSNKVHHVTLSPDGRLVATAAADHTARLWDANTGVPLTPPLQHNAEVTWIEFSPDAHRVVTAGGSFETNGFGEARIWDATTGAALTPLMTHAAVVVHVAFSSDGRRVATASKDKTARVWDARTGIATTPPLSHRDLLWRVAFSPDNGRVLTASEDGTARVWDANTGLPVTPPLKHAGHDFWHHGVEHAAFSPDGHRVVTASDDKTARVWDAATGAPITPPLEHNAAALYATFSHDGRYVTTASEDKTARVWDATTGQPITPPLEHDGEVQYAMFSPDDRAVRTVSHDNAGNSMQVRTWDLAPDNRATEDLLLLAQVLSLRRLDASGTLVPVDTDTISNTWRTLRQR